MTTKTCVHMLSIIAASAATWAAPQQSPAQTTTRVSVSTSGLQANSGSFGTGMSADGRFVVFLSSATNLVNGDSNGRDDVFVHDRETGQTTRVNVSSAGDQANNHSFNPSISADGRFVAFESMATNLVTGDTNARRDIFVHDLQTGVTERVSLTNAGAQANGDSFNPSISGDGRFIAFESTATNLVAVDANGVFHDIFVRDRQNGTTTLVSISGSGVQSNGTSLNASIAADGGSVAFDSTATNLVADDTNGRWDTFVHELATGQTRRVSVASDGQQSNGDSFAPALSADGRFVAFWSVASNLVANDTNNAPDTFRHDLLTGQTVRVSVSSAGDEGNGASGGPAFGRISISADGSLVAFHSQASNLVPDDSNNVREVFVRDVPGGATARVSVSASGAQGNGAADQFVAISADGRFIAFSSLANNLVEGDSNGFQDVFVRDTAPAGCPADWNGDGQVNSSDISAFITSWLQSVQELTLLGDFNGDGIVNSTDISAFITAWLEAITGGC